MCRSIRTLFIAGPLPPQADPPVQKELLMRLNDGDTATCLDLAHVDHYTFVATDDCWLPSPQDTCFLSGLAIKTRVPKKTKSLITVSITGHGLVCKVSQFDVLLRQQIGLGCAAAGEYRSCKLTGPVVSNPVGLTTCVATCVCEGDTCAHVTVYVLLESATVI